jgi:hypothetical protein
MTPPINLSSPTLCSSGTPSTSGVVTLIGTIGWNCLGIGGGTTASCSATNANGGGVNGGGVNGGINGNGGGSVNQGNNVQQGG